MIVNLKEIDFVHKMTESISISPVRLQDAKDLYQHLCQESHDLISWCPWAEQLNTLQDVEYFLTDYHQQLVENKYFRLGIYCQSHLIGWVSAFNFDWEKGCYELGYWLSLSYQRRGYTLYTIKFMLALLSHIFDLNIIYIVCKKNNYPSRFLAHRLQAKRLCLLKDATLRFYKINHKI